MRRLRAKSELCVWAGENVCVSEPVVYLIPACIYIYTVYKTTSVGTSVINIYIYILMKCQQQHKMFTSVLRYLYFSKTTLTLTFDLHICGYLKFLVIEV